MSRAVLRFVLLVSCAHALVHVYEQSLPAVEQLIGQEFEVGPETTGALGTAWRIPFGLGAGLAGLLADRFGAKRLLVLYLLGCAALAAVASATRTLPGLFCSMLAMGLAASIYHPAGLALIAHRTTPETRGPALGWHGIFGSVGIAAAPLGASLLLGAFELTWRQCFALLAAPGAVLAVVVVVWLPRDSAPHAAKSTDGAHGAGDWRGFGRLVTIGMLFGLLYAAFTHFLPRYLDDVGLRPAGVSAASFRTFLAGGVLLVGAVGQAVAGRCCRRHAGLRRLLVWVLLANAPCLLWMSMAEGYARVAATAALAFAHFMHQPVYNSLVADYLPTHRRSFGYGVSNMLCFGVGALGPALAGYVQTAVDPSSADRWTYGILAGVALLAAAIATGLRPPRAP